MNVAAIDIGSNSIRLLIKDANGVEVVRQVVVTGLGTGVEVSGRLADGPVDATLDVVTQFAAAMRESDVRACAAVATSASRDAENGTVVMDRVAGIIGVQPQIIAGDREAVLSFAGATSGIATTGYTVVIDIGGGSTEIVAGESVVSHARSFDMGSVRLTDRVLRGRPASAGHISNARDVVDATLGDIPWARRRNHVIGVAGTFTSLSAINLGLDAYDGAVVDGSRLSLADINELVKMLGGMTLAETEAIPSLDPARAPVILAGAVIAAQTLHAVEATSVIVSEHDLLDGLVNELISANPGLPAT